LIPVPDRPPVPQRLIITSMQVDVACCCTWDGQVCLTWPHTRLAMGHGHGRAYPLCIPRRDQPQKLHTRQQYQAAARRTAASAYRRCPVISRTPARPRRAAIRGDGLFITPPGDLEARQGTPGARSLRTRSPGRRCGDRMLNGRSWCRQYRRQPLLLWKELRRGQGALALRAGRRAAAKAGVAPGRSVRASARTRRRAGRRCVPGPGVLPLGRLAQRPRVPAPRPGGP